MYFARGPLNYFRDRLNWLDFFGEVLYIVYAIYILTVSDGQKNLTIEYMHFTSLILTI